MGLYLAAGTFVMISLAAGFDLVSWVTRAFPQLIAAYWVWLIRSKQ
jgi:hypothetical protein